MKKWYSISIIGWVVAFVHLTLSVLIVRGFVILEPGSPELELYYGAYKLQFLLLAILCVAWFKGHDLFKRR